MRSIIAVLALAFAVTAHAGKIKADEIIDLGGVQDQNYGAQAVNKHGDVGGAILTLRREISAREAERSRARLADCRRRESLQRSESHS